MDELKRRLTKELQEDFNVKIMDSLSWGLPVHSIEISFQTVMRTKMDILMKMMMIAFQKAEIATVEELSDILLVEQLFIQDLLGKMSRAHMIEKKGGFYALTTIGVQQLEDGLFEHEPESGSKDGLYSPCHRSFLNGERYDSSFEEKEVYRFANEFDDWDVMSLEDIDLVNVLKMMGVESSEGNIQIVISEIISTTDVQIDAVPCLEFRLYNVVEDVLYARVWNTLTEHWDAKLEAQLNEKELKNWREMYL
ncbi:hypothetical protein [Sporosarcina limicola]|uniref:DNA-binding IscR family transcriptional regulator n=1 Tax=Sporosarcina limicola TaxID=34101 RepID=A0A927MQQ5_9BACL|nr:hypothetical protein [Sporosarcina limicola]MBE1555626.1 DNA-binding IscR family transcriptional regulator [Sporosarcina limicola]